MDNTDIQEKTEKRAIEKEEQIIQSALHSAGYIDEEIETKIEIIKSRDNLELRDSIIKEICDQMKSTTCGFAPNFTYRVVSIVANLSFTTVAQKAQSNKIRQYSDRNSKSDEKISA